MAIKKIDLANLTNKKKGFKLNKSLANSKSESSPTLTPQIETTFDEETQIYTQVSTTVNENGITSKEITKYRLHNEKVKIKKGVFLRKKLLLEKFGDASFRVGYSPMEELVKFYSRSDKNEGRTDATTIFKQIKCQNCGEGHFTKECPTQSADSRGKFSLTDFTRKKENVRTMEIDHSPVIRVNNIPMETTPDDLNNLFRQFGAIKKIKIAEDRKTNTSRGYAFVTFCVKSEAEKAFKAVQNHRYGRMVINLEWGKTISEMIAEREKREKQGKGRRKFYRK